MYWARIHRTNDKSFLWLKPPANSSSEPLEPSLGHRIGGRLGWILLASLAIWTTPLQGQVDDFNDGNADGWTEYDPISQHPSFDGIATYSFPNTNSYRIESAPSPAPALPPNGVGPGRVGALLLNNDYFDFYISVDILDFDPALDQAFGIIARLDDVGLGQTDGYAFTYDAGNGDLDITGFLNEDPSGGAVSVEGNEVANLMPGHQYRMVFTGVGFQLTGSVYELPDTENPIASITGVDTIYRFPSGPVGLLNYDLSGSGRTDVTYDNFAAFTSPPPRFTFQLAPDTGDLIFFWPNAATSFVLQTTTNLSSPSTWTTVPPPYDQFDDMFFYLVPGFSAPRQFFRLMGE